MKEINIVIAFISYSIRGVLPLIFFNTVVKNKINKRRLNILSIVLTAIIFFLIDKNISGIVHLVSIYIYIIVKYIESLRIKVFLFIQFIIINLSITIIFLLGISYQFNYSLEILINENTKLGILIKSAMVLVQYIILYLLNRNKISLEGLKNKKIYNIFIIITVINFYLLISTYVDVYKLENIYLSYLSKSILIFIMNYLFFIVINLLSREYISNKLLSIEKERLEAQTRYTDEIEESYKKIIELRHDYNNHLNVITNLAISNKSKEVAEYIKEIEQRFLSTDIICKSDNIIIDSLVNSKYMYANEMGIKFDVKIDKIGKINILDTDLCSLLGNLLDNAIEATIKAEKKYINLEIKKSKKYLSIKIYNTINDIVKYENGKILTTKNKKNHGIGLNKINSIVNDYNGYIKISHDEKKFEVSTFLLVF